MFPSCLKSWCTKYRTWICSGFTGRQIKEEVRKIGCIDEFIMLSGNSRINVKLKGSEETEINAQGPYISEQSLKPLFEKLVV